MLINILHIASSHKVLNSITTRLGKAIIDKIRMQQQSEVSVQELDLVSDPFPHFSALQWESYHIPAHELTPDQAQAVHRSDQAIRQLLAADILVISAPMHNYGIPSALKAYLDHVVRAGVTFGFSENGAVGIFKNKKAYIAFSAGWDFSDPALKSFDFATPYLKAVLELIGFEVVGEFRVEGVGAAQEKEVRLKALIKTMIV
ncbi:FMN-dependent NADH-azoreductase [Pedobacter westerhofensis]|uniref:FMN dependent NADH:quinone oxidoreductase n=2 Tax=Pedobacter westerhofensis TaxID=425512 RepID=A0A521FEH0_9SPHI|nr:FMN-dependent NADH-azoreductase [Pedobacter westerhofensis]